MMELLGGLGARLWENHGFWIDKDNDIVQTDYNVLPLLGKIGFNMMAFALKHSGYLE